MAASGENRSGRRLMQCSAPACLPAAPAAAGLASGAGMTQQEPAFSARHGRRGSARGRRWRLGATRGFT